jgi:hypothetical protein
MWILFNMTTYSDGYDLIGLFKYKKDAEMWRKKFEKYAVDEDGFLVRKIEMATPESLLSKLDEYKKYPFSG